MNTGRNETNQMAKKFVFCTRALLAQFPPHATAQNIGDALGVKRSTIERWRWSKCHLEYERADEMAVRIGLHPCEIWQNWFEEALNG